MVAHVESTSSHVSPPEENISNRGGVTVGAAVVGTDGDDVGATLGAVGADVVGTRVGAEEVGMTDGE